MTLSPEALGTLAALKQCGYIKHYTPDCAEALMGAGLARLEQDALAITEKGVTVPVYELAAQSKGLTASYA